MADNEGSMQGRDLVRALLWGALAFFAWQIIAARIWPPPPPSDALPAAGDPAFVEQSAETADSLASGNDQSTPSPDGYSSDVDGLHVSQSDTRTVVIGISDLGEASPYRMAAVLSSVGASLASVELSDHAETVDEDSPRYRLLKEASEGEQIYRSFTTEKIHFRSLNKDVELGDVDWKIDSQSEDQVVFSADIYNGETPLLTVRKRFELPNQSASQLRSDLGIILELENRSDISQTIIVTSHGPVGVKQENMRFDARGFFAGFNAEDGTRVENGLVSSLSQEKMVYRAETGAPPLSWTALANKYFVVFERPVSTSKVGAAEWIGEIWGLHLSGNPDNSTDVTFRKVTVPLVLQPGETRRLATECYLGAKSRKAFQTVPEYVEYGYVEQIDASYGIGPCSFMTFSWLTKFMIWLLNMLKIVVINYGIAIIILVMIVRLILHPVTKKGQVNMMRMQERMSVLGPKQEELKKRYGNDKSKLNQEMMKLYQEEGVNPATNMLSSCMPMMLQMPIWIALYTSLNYNIDMRHQPFFLWINDLTAPDALFSFSERTIPLISFFTGPISSFNLLPILVSAAMFSQQKLMPKPKPAAGGQSSQQAAQAEQMQKIMPYTLLIFGLFFYNMPSGLNLYIGASSAFGTLEQWRIRKHIAGLKEKGNLTTKAKPKPSNKRTRPSFFERLRKAAEEAEKVKSRRKKKGK